MNVRNGIRAAMCSFAILVGCTVIVPSLLSGCGGEEGDDEAAMTPGNPDSTETCGVGENCTDIGGGGGGD